jgi:4'-phosphopantetheinyl transferase
MIELWYTTFDVEALPPEVFAAQLARLPGEWQRKVLSRQRPASRQGTLFGALLLQHVLYHQPGTYTLNQVQHTPTNRPYLPGAALDFNLSHSGSYAVCALSPTGRVGIDLEYRTRRNLAALRAHFRPEEWATLATADPLGRFYQLWTQKEAVAKADGRGLDIALRDICIQQQQAELAGTRWQLQEIPLAADYILHLASNTPMAVSAPREVRLTPQPPQNA